MSGDEGTMREIGIFKRDYEKSGEIDVKRTGRKIKRFCEEKKISVKAIQKELYIGSFQSVYAWFSGKTLPSLDNIYRLSRLLKISIDEMIVDMADGDDIWVGWFLVDDRNEENWQMNSRFLAYYEGILRLAG